MYKFSYLIIIIPIVIILSIASISHTTVDASEIGVKNGESLSFRFLKYTVPDANYLKFYTNTTRLVGNWDKIFYVTVTNSTMNSDNTLDITYRNEDKFENSFVSLNSFGDLIVFTNWTYWESRESWFYNNEWYSVDQVDITNGDNIFEIKITDEYIRDISEGPNNALRVDYGYLRKTREVWISYYKDTGVMERISFKLTTVDKSHSETRYEILLANSKYTEPFELDIFATILGISILIIIILKIRYRKNHDLEKISESEIYDPDIQAELDEIDNLFA